MLVALYLFAIVAANLLVAQFGPSISVFNAFVFIGFDLTTRDALHEQWHGHGLVWKMLALIVAGGGISYALNRDALPIAVASCVAFVASETVDFLVYSALHRRSKLVKMNGSNIASAAVDSLVFPVLAFGGFLWPIILGQFVAKTVGGALWVLVLRWWDARKAVAIQVVR